MQVHGGLGLSRHFAGRIQNVSLSRMSTIAASSLTNLPSCHSFESLLHSFFPFVSCVCLSNCVPGAWCYSVRDGQHCEAHASIETSMYNMTSDSRIANVSHRKYGYETCIL